MSSQPTSRRCETAVGDGLLADILLGEGTLEFFEDFATPNDRLLVEMHHLPLQADVHQKELERRIVGIGRQGDAGFEILRTRVVIPAWVSHVMPAW